jgi:hypothetical protein
VIGSLPIEVDEVIHRTSAYLLDGVVDGKRNWVCIPLGDQSEATAEQMRGRIHLAEELQRLIDPLVKIGTTVVVTADSLQDGASEPPMTVVESDRAD